MNTKYLEQAKKRIPNIPVLINVISRRVRQLNNPETRALVKPDGLFMEKVDLALKEVAEGKLTAEIGLTSSETPSSEGNVITL